MNANAQPLWSATKRSTRHCTLVPRGALRTDACRQAREQRRPRARGTDRRGLIPNMLSIHQRPPAVEERMIPDIGKVISLKGANNCSAVGTLVERSTSFVTLIKMIDANAAAAIKGFSTVLKRIDAQ